MMSLCGSHLISPEKLHNKFPLVAFTYTDVEEPYEVLGDAR